LIRAKKKQSNLEKLKRIPDDATLNTEEVYFVDSTTLNCDPIVEESHEPSDILMPSTFNASAPGTGKDPIDLQNSVANFLYILDCPLQYGIFMNCRIEDVGLSFLV